MGKKKLISKEETLRALDELDKLYPEAGCSLDYKNTYNLIVAVVLSAQTTDVSVNKVTPVLFDRYPEVQDLASAELDDVEKIIHKIGLYKNKAKNIIGLAKEVVEKFDSKIPGNYDDLVSLPGVGRKTANVVLAEGFGLQKIAVDTHVFRVSNRIGIVNENNPLDTEISLMKKIPEFMWTHAHHLLIFHGRGLCTAKNPKCVDCPINCICLYNIDNNI